MHTVTICTRISSWCELKQHSDDKKKERKKERKYVLEITHAAKFSVTKTYNFTGMLLLLTGTGGGLL